MNDALEALFGKADYSHIARDATVTVSITAAEMAALLGAYDRGLDALDQDERDGLNAVISKLGITKSILMSTSNGFVTLRLMTEQDLPMLYEWLNRPHIVEWWGGEEERPTLADVQKQYLPSALAQESVTPYIAMLNGEPIGYAQSYVALGSGDGWWEEETDPGVRGIDQSLANASQLGKGLGTKLVRALVELLFNDPEVTKIQTDPSPSNLRAIRCYEKAGFERQGTVTTPDGPAVYMVQTRQAFERTRSDA